MKRLKSALMSLILLVHPAVEAQDSIRPWLDSLEKALEEKLEAEASRAPEQPESADEGDGELDWVDNFIDPEGNTPQVSAEELRRMVPALLSVERKVQHATACQYWLKMDNRLPFKIRNLALQFSAYILGDGYDQPVLFDSVVKSFSELRPTDEQYRDIFFEYAECDKLDFIKVEDAGRCSVGGLTKFSSQSGDCARFVEVKESDDICIYLDTSYLNSDPEAGERRRPPDNPCGLIAQPDVDILLEQFEVSYEGGDLDTFVALFDEDVTVNGGVGLDQVRRDYGELFRESKSRSMEFRNLSWKPRRNGGAVVRFDLAVTVDKDSYWGPDEYQVDGTMTLIKRKNGVFINSFLHHQKEEGVSLPDFL